MVEAISSLTQAQRLAQRQLQAVRVLCERRAQEEIKDQIRRQGKVKLRGCHSARYRNGQGEGDRGCRLPRKVDRRGEADCRSMAAEGFFGKRAAQRQLERNSQDLHKLGSEPQPLLL